MTNAESYLEKAVEKLNQGDLNSYETEFIEKIQDYTKKDLNKLSKKQFMLLRKIGN